MAGHSADGIMIRILACLLAEPDRLGLYARLGFHSGCAMAQLIME